MAGEPAGDFPGVGEGRGARGRDTAMCGTSPDRDHEDSGDDDDDDVDGDDDVNYFKRSTWWPILQMYKNAVPFIFYIPYE